MVSMSQFTVGHHSRCDSQQILILCDTGSAPDISGQGIVNPVGTILSVAMMLKYSLNLREESKAVEEAVKLTIEKNIRTKDIGGTSTTSEVGDAIAAELEKVLKALP
jgi:3-isopropylmalate dehydrogenase